MRSVVLCDRKRPRKAADGRARDLLEFLLSTFFLSWSRILYLFHKMTEPAVPSPRPTPRFYPEAQTLSVKKVRKDWILPLHRFIWTGRHPLCGLFSKRPPARRAQAAGFFKIGWICLLISDVLKHSGYIVTNCCTSARLWFFKMLNLVASQTIEITSSWSRRADFVFQKSLNMKMSTARWCGPGIYWFSNYTL